MPILPPVTRYEGAGRSLRYSVVRPNDYRPALDRDQCSSDRADDSPLDGTTGESCEHTHLADLDHDASTVNCRSSTGSVRSCEGCAESEVRIDQHQLSIHPGRSEEHTSELQSRQYLVCRLLLEKKKTHM